MTVTFVVAISIILGRVFFLIREVRRPPGPMQWGRTPRWGKRLRVTLDAIILALGLVFFWAFLIEPNRLVVREEAIQLDNWPRELNGLRIAVLSDIHAGGWFIDDKKPQGATSLALTHNPDIFPRVPQRVPLLPAGHTHGAQVKFPFIGTVVHSSRFGKKYERGHVFENNHHLFVTTGIGTSILPLRFGVTPEIVLLTVI